MLYEVITGVRKGDNGCGFENHDFKRFKIHRVKRNCFDKEISKLDNYEKIIDFIFHGTNCNSLPTSI